ncbi:MAG: hypothetical protein ACREPU_00895 [Rhodanobacteraceae bacterium]
MAQQTGPGHQQADATLRDCVAKSDKDWLYNVADPYALHKQPDDKCDWLQLAWT